MFHIWARGAGGAAWATAPGGAAPYSEGMKTRGIVFLVAVLAVLTVTGATIAPRLIGSAIPNAFDLDFRAFGYVEGIHDTNSGCEVEVAIYEWVNLSPGFDIGEIPRQNDRYSLLGDRDSCQALTVAMASTGQHIGFEAGRARGRWYLSDRPSAAYGCGGLEIDWTPHPEGKRMHLRLLAAPLLWALAATATSQPGPLPPCRYDDLPARHSGYDAWALTLLDTSYALGPDYVAPDLVEIDAEGRQLRALLLPDLEALMVAAEAAGAPLAIQSAYRSHSYQAHTFESWVERQGRETALRSSARAGHSEHQLGTAIDFRSADGPPAWELADWATTAAGAWLAANGWRYGFALSYVAGREDETCYDYEPWHYRYIGRDAARELHESGLTLRAWLWQRQ